MDIDRLIRVSDPESRTDYRMSSRCYLLLGTRLFHGLFPLRPTYRSLEPSNLLSGPLKLTVSRLSNGSQATWPSAYPYPAMSTSGHVHFRPCQYAHHASARLSLLEVTTCGHKRHPDDCKYLLRETCVRGLRSSWGEEDGETVMPVWITP